MSIKMNEKTLQKHIDRYYAEYLAIGTSSGPTDRAKAEEAVTAAYKHLGLQEPVFEWFPSPKAGLVRAAQLANGTLSPTKEQIKDQLSAASWGQFEAFWVAYYTLGDREILKTDNPLIPIVNDIVKYCGIYWTFEGLVVMTEKPIELHMKDGKLHKDTGPAILYSDGYGAYYINGVRCGSLIEQGLMNKYVKET